MQQTATKKCIEKEIEDIILAFAVEQPAYGQERASIELKMKGYNDPTSIVCSVWLRCDLYEKSTTLKVSSEVEAGTVESNLPGIAERMKMKSGCL